MRAAEPVDNLPRLRGADPAGIPAGGRDLPVQRHGDFQGHPGTPRGDVFQEHSVLQADPVFQQARFHGDAVVPQNPDSLPADQRIGVDQAHDDPGYPGLQEGVRARGLLAVVAAGFQRHIGRRSGGVLPAVGQGFALGMEPPVPAVPAAADGPAVLDQDATDQRVRGHVSAPPLRQADGLLHVFHIGLVHLRQTKKALGAKSTQGDAIVHTSGMVPVMHHSVIPRLPSGL